MKHEHDIEYNGENYIETSSDSTEPNICEPTPMQMKVSTVQTNDVEVGEDKVKEMGYFDSMGIYEEADYRIERPQLIREYLTEMLESHTHQWYYAKDKNNRLNDLKCIVRVLEMLEE